MKVGIREVGGDSPCFVIAEAGLAHEGQLTLGFSLIDIAVDGGADAVKFQVYETEDLIARDRNAGCPFTGKELFDRFKRKELAYWEFETLERYATDRGIMWFATPHTLGAFEFLEEMNVPAYKIGSGERGGDLFQAVMFSDKPVFVSTGMRTHEEAMDLVEAWGGFADIAFLHCVTEYPVTDPNLGFLRSLGRACKRKGAVMGYSDHTIGSGAILLAVAMGAKVIEKHIKVDESTGQDCAGALNKADFGRMVKNIRRVDRMLGTEERVYSEAERRNEAWALKGKDGKRPK